MLSLREEQLKRGDKSELRGIKRPVPVSARRKPRRNAVLFKAGQSPAELEALRDQHKLENPTLPAETDGHELAYEKNANTDRPATSCDPVENK